MVETIQERKERQRHANLDKLRGLRLIDDEFMRCIFRDNKGFLNGGAVINSGTMMLNETTFSGNSATYGGAIYNNGDIVLKDVSLLTGTDTVLTPPASQRFSQ